LKSNDLFFPTMFDLMGIPGTFLVPFYDLK